MFLQYLKLTTRNIQVQSTAQYFSSSSFCFERTFSREDALKVTQGLSAEKLREFQDNSELPVISQDVDKILGDSEFCEEFEEFSDVEDLEPSNSTSNCSSKPVEDSALINESWDRPSGGVYHLSFQGYDVRFFLPWVEKVGLMAHMATDIYASGPIVLPTRTNRVTPATSPHKFKTAQEHWVLDRHRRMIRIEGPVATLEKFVGIVKQLQTPAVAMRIIRRKYYPIDQYFSSAFVSSPNPSNPSTPTSL